jgi:hypothetical protein
MIERVRGNSDALDILGEIAVGGGEIPPVDGHDAVDRSRLVELLKLLAVQDYVVIVAGFVLQAKFDHAVGAGVRVRVEENGVNEAEDGAGGANADGQGEDGGEREVWAPSEFANEEA